jgi:hypothetical protein
MRRLLCCALLALALVPAGLAQAGVTNPDISVIGQPFIRWNDNASDPTAKRPVFDVGETELVFDAALNPYAKGFFDVTLQGGQIDLEEGYFSLLRGLPGDIQLKGGKYRVGFGKLNPAHPHTYPFANRFGVLAAYLPGDEAYNETGLDVSYRLPLPGSISVTAYGDVLQGDSFRIARAPTADPSDPLNQDPVNGDRAVEPRAAWLGRLATFIGVGDRSGIELGLSATQGTNNVAAAARTQVLGGDVKAKLWTSASAYLLVQGEYLRLDRDNAEWLSPGAGYNVSTTRADGGYVFADYNWKQRYDAGGSFDSYEDPASPGQSVTSVGAFAGLALMEETTVFRLDWRRSDRTGSPSFAPSASAIGFDPVNEVTLRVIFSMGPHKAHQF